MKNNKKIWIWYIKDMFSGNTIVLDIPETKTRNRILIDFEKDARTHIEEGRTIKNWFSEMKEFAIIKENIEYKRKKIKIPSYYYDHIVEMDLSEYSSYSEIEHTLDIADWEILKTLFETL